MRIKSFLLNIFLCSALFAGAQTGMLGYVKIIRTVNWTGKNVHFFGNSITAGVGATVSANRYTSVFSAAVGCVEQNHGVSSMVLQNALPAGCARPVFSVTSISAKQAGDVMLFVALGVNDIGVNVAAMTPSGYQLTMDSLVTNAISKGWAAQDIVLLTPFYFTAYSSYLGNCSVTTAADVTRHQAYADAVTAVARARHTVLADIYVAMKNSSNPASLLSGDGIHPNDTGHAFIAAFLQNLNYAVQ